MLALFCWNVSNAQLLEQKGVAYRYNGKNPRIPFGGVYVKTVSEESRGGRREDKEDVGGRIKRVSMVQREKYRLNVW